jgi:hypothetical protein
VVALAGWRADPVAPSALAAGSWTVSSDVCQSVPEADPSRAPGSAVPAAPPGRAPPRGTPEAGRLASVAVRQTHSPPRPPPPARPAPPAAARCHHCRHCLRHHRWPPAPKAAVSRAVLQEPARATRGEGVGRALHGHTHAARSQAPLARPLTRAHGCAPRERLLSRPMLTTPPLSWRTTGSPCAAAALTIAAARTRVPDRGGDVRHCRANDHRDRMTQPPRGTPVLVRFGEWKGATGPAPAGPTARRRPRPRRRPQLLRRLALRCIRPKPRRQRGEGPLRHAGPPEERPWVGRRGCMAVPGGQCARFCEDIHGATDRPKASRHHHCRNIPASRPAVDADAPCRRYPRHAILLE